MQKNMSDDERARDARETLARVERDSHGYMGSAMQRAADHFAARDGAGEDAAEIWGRRAGRALGLVFLVVLLTNLFTHWLF